MVQAPRQSDSNAPAAYRYDAFLSYSHKDKETVEWLHQLLSRHWVPGKGARRSIFRDDDTLAAGVLTDRLKTALAASRYLIVCCSEHSANSTYVDLEVAEFLRHHPPSNVLACQVGAADGAMAPLPEAVATIERELGGELFKPDLRGAPARAKGAAKRDATRQGLALLAPLVGLPDKEAILDRTARARWWAIAASIAIATLATAIVFATRTDRYQLWKMRRDAPALLPQASAPVAREWLNALLRAGGAEEAFARALQLTPPEESAQAIRTLNETLRELREANPAYAAPGNLPSTEEPARDPADPIATLQALKTLKQSADDFVRAAYTLSAMADTSAVRDLARVAEDLAHRIERGFTRETQLSRVMVDLAGKATGNPEAAKLAMDAVLPQKSDELFPPEVLTPLLSEKYDAAVAAARRIASPEPRLQSLFVIGVLLFQKDRQSSQATAIVREAMAVVRDLKEPGARIRWLTLFANALDRMGQASLVEPPLAEILALTQQNDAGAADGVSLFNTADLLIRLKQTARAHQLADRMLARLRADSSIGFAAVVRPSAIRLLIWLGREDEALALARQKEEPEDRATSLAAAGRELLAQGRKERAARLIAELRPLASRVDDPLTRARIHYEIASLAAGASPGEEARSRALEFLASADAIPDRQKHDDAVAGGIRLLTSLGQEDAALNAVASIRDDGARSRAFSDIAIDAARRHRVRFARLTANQSTVADDRLRAYARILLETLPAEPRSGVKELPESSE